MGVLVWKNNEVKAAALSVNFCKDIMLGELVNVLVPMGDTDSFVNHAASLVTYDADCILYRQSVILELEAKAELLQKLLEFANNSRKVVDIFIDRGKVRRYNYIDILTIVSDFYTALKGAEAALADARSEGLVAFLHTLCDEVRSNKLDEYYSHFARLTNNSFAGGHKAWEGSIVFSVEFDKMLNISRTKIESMTNKKYRNAGMFADANSEKMQAFNLDAFEHKPMLAPGIPMLNSGIDDKHIGRIAGVAFLDMVENQIEKQGANIFACLRGLRDFLTEFCADMDFYGTCLAFKKMCAQKNISLVMPSIKPMEQRALRFEGLSNPALALANAVVENDVEFSQTGEVFILTGSNQGGKTTFLRSIGIALFLAQLGYPVAARGAELSPVESIVTAFAVDEAVDVKQGKLSLELVNLKSALDITTKNSLILLSEPILGSGPKDCLYLSRIALAVILEKNCNAVWVTHLYELVEDSYKLCAELRSDSKCTSLRVTVEEKEGCVYPTYKVIAAPPQYNSFAKELLQRIGAQFD